jgi:hypothetical protein
MANSIIGALRVNLGLDSAQFTRGMGQAQKTLQSARNQFLAVAGAAAALGAAITKMARTGADDIDRIVKGARRIDGSANAFQALELTAGEAGVSLSSLTNDIQTMNRELSAGSSGAVKSLQRLGLSAKELLAMDADDRIASIADRIKEMGLSAGEATQILRDLGVRNREMVLLMLAGGDSIRSAREDIRSYGLEIDDAMGARIEQANDRIGRLGLAASLMGRRLAAEVVPALGAMAFAITESLREGGALRGVIDGLTSNMQLLASIVGTTVVFFGVKYVGAVVAATFATFSFTGALVALRTALLRTGVGALIVGAGVLVDYLIRLRVATGSWGGALSALGDLASGVWEGIKGSAKSIQPALAAVWQGMVSDFAGAISDMALAWAGFLQGISDSVAGVPLLEDALKGVAGAASNARMAAREWGIASAQAGSEAARLRAQASQLATAGFDRAREAAARLAAIVSEGGAATTEAADAARVLRGELDAMGGEGGSGGKAARGVKDVTDALREAEQAQKQWAQNMAGHFDGLITGGKNLSGVLMSMARQLESRGWQMLFSGLGSGGGGGLFGGLFKGIGSLFSFDGGGYTGSGARSGGLDGKGGFLAMMHPQETVIDHTKGQSMGAQQITLRLITDAGVTVQQVGQIATGVAVQVVREGLGQNRKALPSQIDTLSARGV